MRRLRGMLVVALVMAAGAAEAVTYTASPSGYSAGSVITMQLDPSRPRALVRKSDGGTFIASGTMTLYQDGSSIASAPYSAGASTVTVNFNWNFTSGTRRFHALASGNVNPSGNVYVTATDPAPPAAPVATAVAQSPTSIRISWNSVATATRYKVTLLPSSETGDLTGTSHTWTNLAPSTRYCFVVRALREIGVSSLPSAEVCATTQAAPPPAAPVATAVAQSPTSISISWNTVATATRYKVTLLPSSESGDLTGTSHTWTNLAPSTRYCFVVRALREIGVSSLPSAEVCATTQAAPPPAAPVATAVAQSPTSISISWNTVATATRYKVTLLPSSESGDLTGTSHTWTNLAPSTRYCFVVRALREIGVSSLPSAEVCATTQAAPPPAAPVATAVAQSPTSISISWNAVATATRYKVTLLPSSDTGDLTGTSHTWTNLAPSTRYCFVVRALREIGVSSLPSAEVCATTQAAPPPAAPVATAVAQSPTSISISWNAVATATRYKVTLLPSSDTGDLTGTSHTWTNLAPSTRYCFVVRALREIGVSSLPSAEVCATTQAAPPPAAPVATAVAQSPTSISISWNSVATATRYKVTLLPSSESGDLTGTSHTWTNLAPSTRYCFVVRALRETGVSSLPSAEVCATTQAAPPPAAPVATAVAQSPTSISISWNAVATATRYKVTLLPSSETGDLTGTTHTWTNLAPSTRYCFVVRALREIGVSSLPSAEVCATTQAAPPPAAPVATAVAQSPTSISISWNAVATATRYKVTLLPSSETGDLTATSYTWPNLTAATRYCFVVRALREIGVSSLPSAETCATTQAAPVPPPQLEAAPSPVNPTSGLAGQATFVWSVFAKDAASVHVEIRNPVSGGVASFPMQPAGDPALARRIHTYQQSLLTAGVYQFRFRAASSAGAVVYLPQDQSFVSGPTVTSPPECAPPGAFALTAPADGQSVTTAPILGWTAAARTAIYDVYLWKTANGVPARVANVGATSYQTSALDAGTQYSWKIVARADCGAVTESSSGTRRFTLAAAPPPPSEAPVFVDGPRVEPQEGVRGVTEFRWSAGIRNASRATLVIIDPEHGGEHRFELTRAGTTGSATIFEHRKTVIYSGIYRFRIDAVSAGGVGRSSPEPVAGTIAGPTVFADAATPITVDFDHSPLQPLAGELVQFKSLVTAPGVRLGWDFGDGGSATIAEPAHRYEASGEYRVTLTVEKDSAGSAGSITAPAQVSRYSKTKTVIAAPRPQTRKLGGYVRFDDDRPIVNAVVRGEGSSGVVEVRTGSNGVFTVDVPASSSGWRFTASSHDLHGSSAFRTRFASYNSIAGTVWPSVVHQAVLRVRNPIVLIHGFQWWAGNGGAPRWNVWAAELRRLKFPVLVIEYADGDGRSSYSPAAAIAEYVERDILGLLGQFSESAISRPGSPPPPAALVDFNIIAHSKGGLVTRALLRRPIGAHVRKVVTLGTPNSGSYRSVWTFHLSYERVRHEFNTLYPTYFAAAPGREERRVMAVAGIPFCNPDLGFFADDWVDAESATTIFIDHDDRTQQVHRLKRVLRPLHHEQLGANLDPLNADLLAKSIWFFAAPLDVDPGEPGGQIECPRRLVPLSAIVAPESPVARETLIALRNGDEREVELPLPLDGGSVEIAVYRSRPFLLFELRDPTGVDRAAASVTEEDGVRRYRLASPAAGTWKIVAVDDSPLRHSIEVTSSDALPLAVDVAPRDARTGEVLDYRLGAGSGAELTAASLALKRDGVLIAESSCSGSTDHIFACRVESPGAAGHYDAEVILRGRRAGGVAFQRIVLRPLRVLSDRVRGVAMLGGAALDTNQNGRSDTIATDLSADVRSAGRFRVRASLASAGGKVLAQRVTDLTADAAGSASVRLSFDTRAVDCADLSAGLRLTQVRLFDLDRDEVPSETEAASFALDVPLASAECGGGRPIAAFSASRTEAIAGEPVTFTSTARGDVTRLLWDLGDGTESASPAVVHAFANPGVYFVRLDVWNGTDSDYAIQEIVVRGSTPRRRTSR